MQITVPFDVLKQWVNNFKENPDLPFVTTSAKIGFETNNQAKPQFEIFFNNVLKSAERVGLRVYFIRLTKADNDKYTHYGSWEFVNEQFTQVSVAFVPITWPNDQAPKEDKEKNIDTILKDADDNVTIFIPGGESTGLCPKDCNGEI
jgi:hypothetical protein